MRLIKLALISIIVLFVLSVIMSSLLPSRIIVSRAVNIHAPVDSIKKYTADIAQWIYWVEGMQDSSVHVYSSSSAMLGKNKVQLHSISDTTIGASWILQKGRRQESMMRLIPQPLQSVVIVQWEFRQQISWYPWEKIGSMMNDKIMGSMMEQNLERLRQLAEQGIARKAQ